MPGDFFGGRYGFCPQFSGGVGKFFLCNGKRGGGCSGCKSFLLWFGFAAAAMGFVVLVLPIGKRSAEYFVHHEVPLFTQEVLLAADVSVGECFQLSRQITEGYRKGEYDAVKICYTRFDSMMTQTAATMEVLPLSIEPTEQQKDRKSVV